MPYFINMFSINMDVFGTLKSLKFARIFTPEHKIEIIDLKIILSSGSLN